MASSSNNLPIGWADRNNQMSEHDMKLGGAAANNFSNKNKKGAYDGNGTDTYKNSDEIKQHYMALIEAEEKEKQESGLTITSAAAATLPPGWEERQKSNALGEKQYGAFASDRHKNYSPPSVATTTSTTSKNGSNKVVAGGPGVALIQVATHTLDTLATTLEQYPVNNIPMEDRAAFAAAMKRAMDAMAKCR